MILSLKSDRMYSEFIVVQPHKVCRRLIFFDKKTKKNNNQIPLLIHPDWYLALPKSPTIPSGDKHTVFKHTLRLLIFNIHGENCTAGDEVGSTAL